MKKTVKRVVLGIGELGLAEVDGERASGRAYPTGYGIWKRRMCQWKRLSGIMVVGQRGRLIWEPTPPRAKNRRSK